MNKIYKVIWSKVRGCYVVVSELAKSHTKNKKRETIASGSDIVVNALALGVFCSIIGIGISYPVFASGVEAGGTALGSHTVAIGDSAVAGSYKHIVVVDDCNSETGEPVYWSDGSAATGLSNGIYYVDSDGKLIMNQSDESLRIVHDGAVAVGYNAQALSDNSVAIGTNSSVTGEYSTAIGAGASALNSSSTSLGANAVAGGYKFVKVVGGKAENGGAVYYSDGTSASSLPDGIYYVNLAGKILLDQDDVSLRVVQDNATAIGSGSSALGANSSAFGYNSYSSGVSSVALGNDAKSTGENSVALGKNSLSKLKNSVAIGYGAVAGPSDSTTNIINLSDSVAIGTNANAAGNRSVSVGSGSSVTGNHSIGIGYQAVVSGDNSNVIGNGASATGSYGNAIGYGAKSEGSWSTAIGIQSTASAGDTIAFGHSSVASGNNAVAFGRYSEGSGISSISLGDTAKATNSYTEALGYKATASGNSSLAVGSNSSASGTQSGAFGYQANASSSSALALGSTTTASANYSTAIGYNSSASGEKSIALGYSNKVVGASSGAIGDPNNVYGGNSYVIGNNNTVGQNGSTTVGVGTFVLGNNVSTTANNSVALGNNTTLTENDVVSVGSETSKRRIVNVADGTSASNAATVGQTIELVAGDGISVEETGTNSIGQKQYTVSSPLSVQYDSDAKDVVSLEGLSGTKITNLADGEISSASSDAVTGSQLHAEQQTRITADSVLQASISDETTARTDADTALSGRIDTVDSSISTINSDISDLQAKDIEISSSLSNLSDSAVKYSSDDKSSVVLGGTNGTVISNLKNGALSETSTEAVTGSQLYAEQQARTSSDNLIVGRLDGLDSSVSDLNTKTADIETDLTAEVSARTSADSALSSRIDSLSGDVASSVSYDNNDKDKVTFAGVSGTVLSNIKAGTLSETSTEAVTGSQLYAEQQARINQDNTLQGNIDAEISARTNADTALSGRIDSLDSSIVSINSSVSDLQTKDTEISSTLNSLSDIVVKYNNADKENIVLGGVGGTVISNLKEGTVSSSSTEAVTGSQLYAEQQTRIIADTVLQTAVSDEVSAREAAVSGLDTRITALSGNVSALDSAAVKYSSDDKSSVVLGGAAGTVISNVKNGTVSEISTEAVNGSQLYAEQQARIASDNVLTNSINDEISARQTADSALTSRIDTVDSSISTINTNISDLQNKNSELESDLNNLESSSVKYSNSDNTVLNFSGTGGTLLSNLAEGTVSETSTDAVIGSQLYAEQQARIASDNVLTNSINDEISARQAADNTLSGRIDTVSDSVALSVKYTDNTKASIVLDGENGTVISNVKNGTVSETSTEAVNGSQLYAEQQARITSDSNLSGRIDTLNSSLSSEVSARQSEDARIDARIDSINTSISNIDNFVAYDDSDKETITLSGVDGTKIVNVSDGDVSSSSTEAVTGAQLYSEIQSRTAQDNALDTRLGNVETSVTSLGAKDTELETSISNEVTERESEVSRLDTRIDSINTSIGNIENAVLYDGSTKDTISLAGVGGTKITNLADGTISDSSTDAVSGKQLYTEQQARLSADSVLSGKIDTEISARETLAGRVSTAETSLGNLTSSVSNLENSVVEYSDSNKETIALSGVDGTKISNLADGDISDTSTEAVTGAQLYSEIQSRTAQDNALDTRLGNVETSVTSLSAKDTELETSISDEVTERESEVSRLDSRIDAINTSVGNVDLLLIDNFSCYIDKRYQMRIFFMFFSFVLAHSVL